MKYQLEKRKQGEELKQVMQQEQHFERVKEKKLPGLDPMDGIIFWNNGRVAFLHPSGRTGLRLMMGRVVMRGGEEKVRRGEGKTSSKTRYEVEEGEDVGEQEELEDKKSNTNYMHRYSNDQDGDDDNAQTHLAAAGLEDSDADDDMQSWEICLSLVKELIASLPTAHWCREVMAIVLCVSLKFQIGGEESGQNLMMMSPVRGRRSSALIEKILLSFRIEMVKRDKKMNRDATDDEGMRHPSGNGHCLNYVKISYLRCESDLQELLSGVENFACSSCITEYLFRPTFPEPENNVGFSLRMRIKIETGPASSAGVSDIVYCKGASFVEGGGGGAGG
ncbi:hypothetical protein RJ641_026686 [Dillenia turbinata]|uniref:Uncharacterized protein n=1 Tax=Dillenia turbinata TaxID=194707 RepID=A0AAN8ZHG8_9MAGN